MQFSSSKQHELDYSLACLGLDWRVELSLKSLLGLLKDRMPAAWHHSEDINADLIFYNPASSLAQALLRRGASGAPGSIMIPCSVDDPGPAGLSLPIGASSLLRCLEGATAKLGPRSAVRRVEQSSLCQRLDDLLRADDVLGAIISVGGQRGLLDPRQRTVHWTSEPNADAIARLVLGDVEVEPLRAAQAREWQLIAGEAGHAVSWDAPLWAIAIGASGGRLLRRLDPARPYRLARWPDFGMVGRRASDLKCSALLTQRELSVEAVIAASGLPASKVYSFVNACALCGLIEEAAAGAAGSTPAPPPRATSFAGGVLQRIRKAFAIGGD